MPNLADAESVVMRQFVVAAQVERTGAGLGDHEAEDVHPELAGTPASVMISGSRLAGSGDHSTRA